MAMAACARCFKAILNKDVKVEAFETQRSECLASLKDGEGILIGTLSEWNGVRDLEHVDPSVRQKANIGGALSPFCPRSAPKDSSALSPRGDEHLAKVLPDSMVLFGKGRRK